MPLTPYLTWLTDFVNVTVKPVICRLPNTVSVRTVYVKIQTTTDIMKNWKVGKFMPIGAEAMRAYRARNPEFVNTQRQRSRAKSKALYRLAALYPEDFERLLSEELVSATGTGNTPNPLPQRSTE